MARCWPGLASWNESGLRSVNSVAICEAAAVLNPQAVRVCYGLRSACVAQCAARSLRVCASSSGCPCADTPGPQTSGGARPAACPESGRVEEIAELVWAAWTHPIPGVKAALWQTSARSVLIAAEE